MKVVVHIGMHKAASSYLMMVLNKNRVLLEQNGILPIVDISKKDKQLMATGRKERIKKCTKIFKQYIEELGRQVSNNNNYVHAVFSDEALEFMAREESVLHAFNSKLLEHVDEVQYLVIIRDVIDFAASTLQQQVKGFKAYETRLITPARISKNLAKHPFNYKARFQGLLSGGSSSKFIPLHMLAEKTGPVLLAELFEEVLDKPEINLENVEYGNVSIGRQGVAVASFFRYSMLTSLNEDAIPNLLRKPLMKRIISFSELERWFEEKYFPYGNAECQEIYQILESVNDEFSMSVWGRSWADVFPPKERIKSTYEWSSMDEREEDRLKGFFNDFMNTFYQLCKENSFACTRLDFGVTLNEYLEKVIYPELKR
jgi:hypothetical protein